MSEPLARLGANVLGIDAGEANVKAASVHASHDPSLAGNLSYECTTAEALADAGTQFDCVVCSEVVEHVSDVAPFTAALTKLVKVGCGHWGAHATYASSCSLCSFIA